MIIKALKKGKNYILYVYLGHMSETYGIKIILMIDDINGNLTKIYFYDYKSYTNIKIMQNFSNKSISEIITKLGRVNMDFWGLFPNIFLERH